MPTSTLKIYESLPIGIELKFSNIALTNGQGATTMCVMWDQPLAKYDLSRSSAGTYDDTRDYLIEFFETHKGADSVFRYNDPSDNYVTDTILEGDYTDKTYGVAIPNDDGSKYQLYKVYELDDIKSWRPITRPVNDSDFMLYNAGALYTTGYLINHETGVITPDTPDLTLDLTWKGNFDVPVRFASDSISFVTDVKETDCTDRLTEIPTFELLEVREKAEVHPIPPTLPPRLNHDFALDLCIKEVEEINLNTSITQFDSGFEVRASNYFVEEDNTLVPRVYRRFTTGSKDDGDDSELHYILCWYRCTRGGAIGFKYNGYHVQSRGTLGIDVILENYQKECLI